MKSRERAYRKYLLSIILQDTKLQFIVVGLLLFKFGQFDEGKIDFSSLHLFVRFLVVRLHKNVFISINSLILFLFLSLSFFF